MSFLDKIKEKLPFNIGAKKGDTVEGPAAGATDAGTKPPTVKPSKVSPLIESAYKTDLNQKEESFLDAAPEVDESLLEEVEPPKSLLLYVLKGTFTFLVAVGLAAVLFFTSQLTNYLDFATNALGVPSILDKLESTNEEIKGVQTNLNFYNYVQGEIYLDQFSYDGDEYLMNFDIYSNKTMSEEERKTAQENLQKLRTELKKSFDIANSKLSSKIWLFLADLELKEDSEFEELFESLLEDKLKEGAAELADGEMEADKRDYKLYKQTQKLISNSDLKTLLQSADIDALSDSELVNLIKEINSSIENDLHAIQKIKDTRINWSEIMNQIELETAYVDQYFSEGYYDTLGGIQYTSYDFDTSTGKVTISGTTKRYDTNNFTLISNLIDKMDSSPYFQDVEMKSFTKSGSAEDGYTATLRLNFGIQKDTLHSADEQVLIESLPDFLTTESGVAVDGEAQVYTEVETDEEEVPVEKIPIPKQ